MISSAITNSLLRIDGITEVPPLPFERPNDKMDFFVLELGQHDDVDSWCGVTADTLRSHAEFLQQMRAAGAVLTVFVEFTSALPVLRLDTSFLRVLADAGISLECYHSAG